MPTTTKTTTKKTVAIVHNASVWPMLKKWQTKLAGVQPTAAQLQQAVNLGYRAGTNTAMAVAMYLRTGGATQSQIQAANGLPYLNVHRQMVANGASKNKTTVIAAKAKTELNGKMHTVYSVALKAAKKAGGKGKVKKPATRNTKKAKVAATPPTPA